ncbi:PREDICTED: protein FAM133 isoform X2 [Nelumbo nucifera]|uniref:Protein FAM133 isoform X2 n=1 Tax=Nelumbo nucifera TaxID=4432 RepID=A0A1U8AG02_NELNU|nr:PREDICTED: protein FAM133 isoform X2 [Nelumbo nucifera]
MSRCFPYPPPGYERKNDAEAQSESIKRERHKAKKERKKEKRREKKEKKEKEKDKARENGHIEKRNHCHEKRHKDKSKVDNKGGEHPRNSHDESGQLEKSGLTEEHGQAAVSQNPDDSSDSTQNSHKRKKHSTSSDVSHNHASILRIRLPLVKHKDPEMLPSKEVAACSSSGRIVISSQGKCEATPEPKREEVCSTSDRSEIAIQDKHANVPCSSIGVRCSTSRRNEVVAEDRTGTCTSSFPAESDEMKIELRKYRDLIQNWVPPAIQSEYNEFDNQDWLFEVRHESKKVKVDGGSSSHGTSSDPWPRCCYLREVDIYALPFTVPF